MGLKGLFGEQSAICSANLFSRCFLSGQSNVTKLRRKSSVYDFFRWSLDKIAKTNFMLFEKFFVLLSQQKRVKPVHYKHNKQVLNRTSTVGLAKFKKKYFEKNHHHHVNKIITKWIEYGPFRTNLLLNVTQVFLISFFSNFLKYNIQSRWILLFKFRKHDCTIHLFFFQAVFIVFSFKNFIVVLEILFFIVQIEVQMKSFIIPSSQL